VSLPNPGISFFASRFLRVGAARREANITVPCLSRRKLITAETFLGHSFERPNIYGARVGLSVAFYGDFIEFNDIAGNERLYISQGKAMDKIILFFFRC